MQLGCLRKLSKMEHLLQAKAAETISNFQLWHDSWSFNTCRTQGGDAGLEITANH
jgi:hypothetical protein